MAVITCGRYIAPRNAVPYIALHLFMYASLLVDYVSHCNTADTSRRGQYVTFLLLASTRNLSFPEATKGLPVYNASWNQAVDVAEFRVPCGVKLNFLLTRQDADVKGNQRDYSSVRAAISLIQKLMLTNSVRSQCGSARDVSIGLTRKS